MRDLEFIQARLEAVPENRRDGLWADLLRAVTGWESTQQAFNLMREERVDVSTGEAARFRKALEQIVEVASRSDAHPDIDVLSIAKEALEYRPEVNVPTSDPSDAVRKAATAFIISRIQADLKNERALDELYGLIFGPGYTPPLKGNSL